MTAFNPMGRPAVTTIRTSGAWKALPGAQARTAPWQATRPTTPRAPQMTAGDWHALDAYQQIVRDIGQRQAPAGTGVFPLLGRFGMAGAVPALFAMLLGAACAEEVSSQGDTTPRARPPVARPAARNIVVRVPRTDGGATTFMMTPKGILHAMTRTPPVSRKAVEQEAGADGVETMRQLFERRGFSGVTGICWGRPTITSRVVPFDGDRVAFEVRMICDVSRTPKIKREAIMRSFGTPVEEAAPRTTPRPRPVLERPRPPARRVEPRRPADDDGDDEIEF